MFGQTIFHDTAELPTDVLSLVDGKFYDFVHEKLGEYQSTLLKIQQINSVACFLVTNDPCQVLNLSIDDDDLKMLKKHVCFLLSNGLYVVKHGVQSGFKCLRDMLTRKSEEKFKQLRNSKPQAAMTSSINTPPASGFVSVSSLTNVSPLSQTTTTVLPSSEQTMSITDHRRYSLNLLKQWCSTHTEEFSLQTLDLREGRDFNLNVSFGQNGDVESSVKCKCNCVIRLTSKNGKIQLCNFQKHLRMTNCSHVKSLQTIDLEQRSRNSNQVTTNSSLTDFDTPASPLRRGSQQRRSPSSFDSPATKSPSTANLTDARSIRRPRNSRTNTSKRKESSSKPSPSRSAKRTRN